MKSKIHALLGSLLLSGVGSLFAQDGQSVSLKVDLVAWGDEIKGLSLKNANTSAGLTAIPFQYSTALSYAGSNVMEIYQIGGTTRASRSRTSSPGESAEDQAIWAELAKRKKENPNLVALAKLPLNSKRVTVLLTPGRDGTYRTIVIDDTPEKLPLGQLRIHNHSPMSVALRCNKASVKELKICESFVVIPKDEQIIYELAYKNGDKWTILENNIIRVQEGEQAQMIILKSDNAHFVGSSGDRSGFLQSVVLRRQAQTDSPPP